MKQRYQTLKAGDRRQEGDEYTRNGAVSHNDNPMISEGNWFPVNLIGQLILESDLITGKYRRPL